MGARHTGRQAALKMLFQMETTGDDAARTIELFWRNFDEDPEGRAYADRAVRGVGDTLAAIDEQIAKASQNWRVERMARVDRNVLRLGAWELMAEADVPRSVILDEAVELAKEYGTDESSAFVNGVLHRVAETLGRVDAAR